MLSGEAPGRILHFPDEDLRYQKTLDFHGKQVKGVWHSPNESINNIWVDGVGHLACAFYEANDTTKGNFYANQMDNYLLDRTIDGKQYKILTYLLTDDGNDRGSISCAAWYIFAKNQFNPMKLVLK